MCTVSLCQPAKTAIQWNRFKHLQNKLAQFKRITQRLSHLTVKAALILTGAGFLK